jgi:phage FluMu protein Com
MKLIRCYACNQIIKKEELHKYQTSYKEPLCKQCFDFLEVGLFQ